MRALYLPGQYNYASTIAPVARFPILIVQMERLRSDM